MSAVLGSLRAPPRRPLWCLFAPVSRGTPCRCASTATQHQEGAGFWSVQGTGAHELVVKKSKFVALAFGVASHSHARARIEQLSDAAATHNCFAYRLSTGADKCTDDGEPSGTAGRPILQAIERLGFNDTCVLVTRHFGGTKLGTGGLARAYGQAASLCLAGCAELDPAHAGSGGGGDSGNRAWRVWRTPHTSLTITVELNVAGKVFQVLGGFKDAVHLATERDGALAVEVTLPEELGPGLVRALQESTKGRCIIVAASPGPAGAQ